MARSGAAPAGSPARPLAWALFVLAVAGAAVSVLVAVSGGGRFEIAGWRVSVRSPWPSALLAAVCALISWGLAPRGSWPPHGAWDRNGSRLATFVAMGVAAATALLGLVHGSAVPSGADASGYLSQAQLWRSGGLTVSQPAITEAPWPAAAWTYSPLGFRPGLQPGTLVPTYPPGLPLHFAALGSLAGPAGERLVVPVLGAIGVWAAFLLGRRVSGAFGGLAAAVLLASSPVWLNQLLQPMSDVPATAWWLVSLAIAAGGRGPTASRAALAGVAAGVAWLVRPNLVLLLPVPLVLCASRHDGARPAPVRAVAAYCAGAAPALAGLALFNASLYGGPLASGYGSAGELFDAAFVATNVRLYGGWLLDVHTPLVATALTGMAALVAGRRPEGADRVALALALVSGVVILSYLPYAPFESWTYLRFLLPAIAALAVAAGVTLSRVAELRPAMASPVAVLVLVALAAASWDTARDRGVFSTAQRERRYALAAAWVEQYAPPGTSLLAAQHSGSLFAATRRPVIRWDLLDPRPVTPADAARGSSVAPAPPATGASWLDVAWAAGPRQPDGSQAAWLVVDADEEPAFRRRFASVSELGRLDWPPSAATDPPDSVRIYRLDDRVRYRTGLPVRTERIAPFGPR